MPTRPNLDILFIMTDQQSWNMMSCMGNADVNTPAMDRLAAMGRRFDRAYCANPVCVPSRFSIFTGRLSSDVGLRGNLRGQFDAVPQEIKTSALGWQMRRAGYRACYGGKVHLPKMTIEEAGFEYLCQDQRDELANFSAKFLSQPQAQQPLFYVASFINPHDICHHSISQSAESDFEKAVLRDRQPVDEIERALDEIRNQDGSFDIDRCPKLPPNFEPQANEPEAMYPDANAVVPAHYKAFKNWTEERWRLHRWIYARLTERVDQQIGQLIDALEQSGRIKDTIIIFTSDHGEMNGAHRREAKSYFYDEAARVPLIVIHPRETEPGSVDASHVVSNGLDLLPTFCDYAGVEPPLELEGQSIRGLARGQDSDWSREFVPIVNDQGYAIVSPRWKYARYDKGSAAEQLIDLHADPGEMRNLASEAAYADALEQCRKSFEQCFANTRLATFAPSPRPRAETSPRSGSRPPL